MTVSTYYYPGANGGGETVPGGPASGGSPNYSGTASFQVQFQSAPGTYTKVVYDTSNPGQAVVTFNYGASNSLTETLTITQYGNSGQVETTDGTYNYLLSNSAVAVGQTYALAPGGSSQFMFNPSFASDPTCFVAGTRILTTRGQVPIEDLRLDDVAITLSGSHRKIVWLGQRTMRPSKHPEPWHINPIRVSAEAFAPGVPERDLRLSPGHSICVDLLGEVLIPALSLCNGTTIVQEKADEVSYWHVELEGGHGIVFAESLPCESYLEMDNRGFFVADQSVTSLRAVPDATVTAVTHADFCRPFHAEGPIVAFARERLAARATREGWRQVENRTANVHLVVDGQRIEPEIRDLVVRFLVPAGAMSVLLVSDTAIPAEVDGTPDPRTLGVCVGRLVLDDGFASQVVTADDPRLCAGFHHVEAGPQRWTGGRARLPSELWEGCRGAFFLRVELRRSALPRWAPPADVPARPAIEKAA